MKDLNINTACFYDYSISFSSGKNIGAFSNSKNYFIMDFLPYYNAKKIFKELFSHEVHHIFYYLKSLSGNLLLLIKKGFFFSDLKTSNTLYDPKSEKTFLIDLDGIISVGNIEALKCLLKKNHSIEYTLDFSAPEINNKEIETCDAIKCMAYSLGAIIAESIKQINFKKLNERDEKIFKKLRNLSDKLRNNDPILRYSIEEASMKLKKLTEKYNHSFSLSESVNIIEHFYRTLFFPGRT